MTISHPPKWRVVCTYVKNYHVSDEVRGKCNFTLLFFSLDLFLDLIHSEVVST